MEFYSELAANNLWLQIWPEILVALFALKLLGLEMFMPKSKQNLIPKFAVMGQIVITILFAIAFLCGKCQYVCAEGTVFNGMIENSRDGNLWRLFFLICSIFVSHLGMVYVSKQKLPRVEFFHIVLVLTASLMLLAQSSHFVMLFVALETVTIGFYILISYGRSDSSSLEAGLKYLIQAGLSSAILLFGIVLLYGAAGNPNLVAHSGDPLNFENLGAFLSANPGNIIAITGLILVISAIIFKIGAVPFQIWVSDVYQGAPTPITAFLAVGSKAAGFVILLNLLHGPFASMQGMLEPILSAVAVVTIIFGNTGALGQSNVKRIIGMSGIAHAGYLLIGVIASFHVPYAIYAVYFYLLVYLFASFGVFEVMNILAPQKDSDQDIKDYTELLQRKPLLGWGLITGLASLAGIPPLGGFIGKLLIFIAAVKAGLYSLLIVAIIGVVISIYYYFGWIRVASFKNMFITHEVEETCSGEVCENISGCTKVMIIVLSAVSLLIGLYPAIYGIIG